MARKGKIHYSHDGQPACKRRSDKLTHHLLSVTCRLCQMSEPWGNAYVDMRDTPYDNEANVLQAVGPYVDHGDGVLYLPYRNL